MGLEEEAPLPESAVGVGRSSRLMTFFGSGMTDEEGFGGTSTSGVIGMEAGEGLSLFFWACFRLPYCTIRRAWYLADFEISWKGVSRKLSYYPGLVKNFSMPPCALLPVSISLTRSFSF
jgi:hypothetical protein